MAAWALSGRLLVNAAVAFSSQRLVSRHPATVRTAPALKVAAGVPLPDVVLYEGQPNYAKPIERRLGDLARGKRIALLAIPGAFTPGCSMNHVPSFIEGRQELANAGVDLIICTATNDPYVMYAFGQSIGVPADASFMLLSDKNAELCRALGLATESDVFVRSQRYSLVAQDGIITHFFPSVSDTGEKISENTFAPSMLNALRG